MKLISLKLLNFRRFKEETLNFSSDFSIIYGKNWAWKSSVIDAIWFCLFWASSKDFSRIRDSKSLKSYFSDDKQPSKIELIFDFSWSSYRLVRVINKWTKIFQNDFIEEKEDTLLWDQSLKIVWWVEITNYVKSLIWIDRDTFLRSVFARQKDLQVLSGKKEDRKNLINSVLWIDKIEDIIWVLKEDKNSKQSSIKFIKTSILETDLDSIKKDFENISKNKKEIEKERKSLEKELIKNQKDIAKIEKEYRVLEEKKEKYQEIEKSKSLLSQKQDSSKKILTEKKDDLKSIEEKKSYLEKNKWLLEKEKNLFEKLKDLEKSETIYKQKLILEKGILDDKKSLETLYKSKKVFLQEIWERFSVYKLDANNFQDSLEKLKLYKDSYLKEVENLEKRSSTLEANMQSVEKFWNDLKKELYDIEKLSDKADCPMCKRPLWDYAPKLKKIIEEKISQKRLEYKPIKDDFDKVSENLKILKDKEKRISSDLIFFDDKSRKLIVLEKDIESFEKNMLEKEKSLNEIKDIDFDLEKSKILKKDYYEVKALCDKLKSISWEIKKEEEIKKDIKNLENDLKTLEKDLSKLLKDKEKLWFDSKYYLEKKEAFEKSKDYIIKQKDIISEIDKSIFSLDKELLSLENKIKSKKDNEEKVEKLSSEVFYLDIKINLLRDYAIYLLAFLKPKIELLASDYFNIITNWKYTSISLTSDYTVEIDYKTIDLYSGWEQDLANLCLRLALGQNLSLTSSGNQINFLILDEVLWSQDTSRQENIMNSLKKLESKFSQIILISHVDELRDFASNLIEIRQKNREESEIVDNK